MKDDSTHEGRLLPRRGYLGFGVVAHPPRSGSEHERWLVSEFDPGSPAEHSGLKLGDEVIAIDGVEVMSLAMLRERAARVRPRTTARIGILRHDRAFDVALVADEMPLESLASGRAVLGEVPWTYQGDTFRLRAVWTLPEGAIRSALWLLPSATWLSQECPLDAKDPTFQLIASLTAAGIATLRVDRSGLGDSEGPPVTELDFHAEMAMWEAARGYYLAHDFVAKLPRFLYGRSLGGMLAPLLALGHDFAGVIACGTSSAPWHEASLRSTERQARLAGMPEDELRQEMRLSRLMQELVYLHGHTPDEARRTAPELGDRLVETFAGRQVHGRTSRFFQQLQRAPVERAWVELEARVLALHAEYDILTERADLERIAELVGPRARFVPLPGVDHFLHQRPSFEVAVRVPWGGEFSQEAARVIAEFLLGN